MSETIRSLFSSIAPRYDWLNSLLSLGVDRSWRRHALEAVKDPRFATVMDLCAGTLALTRGYLEGHPRGHVTAVDFAEPMLNEGLSRLPASLKERLQLSVQDATQLNFPEKSFDAALCAYGLRNIDDNATALKKVLSVLRPGGRLVVLEFFRPETWITRLFHGTYAALVIPMIGGFISKDPAAYRHLRDSIRKYYSVTEFCELLKGLGYRNITATPQTFGISHRIVAEVPQ